MLPPTAGVRAPEQGRPRECTHQSHSSATQLSWPQYAILDAADLCKERSNVSTWSPVRDPNRDCSVHTEIRHSKSLTGATTVKEGKQWNSPGTFWKSEERLSSHPVPQLQCATADGRGLSFCSSGLPSTSPKPAGQGRGGKERTLNPGDH